MITLRKGIGIVCAALMCLLCFAALADEENGFVYAIYGDYARITGYNGTAKDLKIPETLGGKPVQVIGGFEENKTIESVTIPETVKDIRYDAFKNCTSLRKATFADQGVKTIGQFAFTGCTSLEEVQLPHSLTEIGSSVFRDCSALKSFTLTPGIEKVGGQFLQGCTGLKELIIEDGVTTIPGSFARELTGITSITIPASVQTIEAQAFYSATNLGEVIFHEKMDGALMIGDYAFSHCSELETIDLPENTVAIGNYCFNSDEKLKVLDIPDSVAEFGEAFVECTMIVGKDSPALAAVLQWKSTGYIIREYYDPQEAGAGLTDPDEKAEAVVKAVVKSGMSAYEKALALHDYLIYHAMVTFDADKKGEAQGTAALIR